MSNLRDQLTRRYVEKLRRFLADRQETYLHEAYELGRNAVSEGLGVLDMAKLHRESCALLRTALRPAAADYDPLNGAETFFLEALSPFEATHRGFREANTRLQQLIGALEERNSRLAVANRELANEILERKRTEEMLQRYEAIVNNSNDFMTLISADYRYVAVNNAYCQALGQPRDRILGYTVAHVWGGEVFAHSIRKNLEQCFAGHDAHYEAWFETPNLGRRCFNVNYYPYRAEGHVTHAIVVTHDITPLKLAVEASAHNEMMLAEAQQVARLGSWEWNIVANVLSWSTELYRIYGLAPQDAVTTYKGFLDRVHPADRRMAKRRIDLALSQGQPFDFHYRIVRTDGQVRILHAQGRVIAGAEGKPIRVHGIGQDVTEFKQAQEALRTSEARLQAVLDHSPALIFLKDLHGRYLLVNRQFERRFNLGRGQVIGHTDHELFAREQAAVYRANDRKVLRAGVPMEFEEAAQYHNGDGTHFSIVSRFPLRDTAGKIYALGGIATDITERKRAEEALRLSEEHYRQLFNEARIMQENLRNLSNRILHIQEAERKRISRELHDEVGQALTAINVNLAMLKQGELAKTDALQQRLADTQQLLEHTMEAVHRFARELRPSVLDDLGLVPALRSFIKDFSRRYSLQVRFVANEEVEQLDGERKTVVFRVAQESLTNVAKHAHASRVSVVMQKRSGSVRLEIKDNGQAFRLEPGLAVKGKKRLGLLGMQERVRLVNGDFAIHSEPGKGTTVRVDVPLASPAPVGESVRRPLTPAREGAPAAPAGFASHALNSNRRIIYVQN